MNPGCLAYLVLVAIHPPATCDEETRDCPRRDSEPSSEDFESIDGIIGTLYEVISGPKGKERDWDRLRSLFHSEARLVPMVRRDDRSRPRVLTLEEFIEIAGPAFEDDGFYENEISRTTVRFGQIAHAFSTYEARRAKDEDPFIRGINSIQLVHDGKRWWILTITWDTERGRQPIPDEYLR